MFADVGVEVDFLQGFHLLKPFPVEAEVWTGNDGNPGMWNLDPDFGFLMTSRFSWLIFSS